MPASWAHPVAAIPFKRFGLSLSSLIIGSIAPDILYLLPLPVSAKFGHTMIGLFVFCLPLGIIVLWGFHALLKFPLFSLLPTRHQQRIGGIMYKFHFGPRRHFLVIVLSVFLGSCTHILWDSCTHHYGWPVQYISFLRLPLFQTSEGILRLNTVLQHVGTLFGTLLLLYWYFRWLSIAPIGTVPYSCRLSSMMKWMIAGGIIVLAASIGGFYGYAVFSNISDLRSFRNFLTSTAVAVMACLSVELFLYSFLWHVVRRKPGSG